MAGSAPALMPLNFVGQGAARTRRNPRVFRTLPQAAHCGRLSPPQELEGPSMKRAKEARPSQMRSGTTRTGRDGAIDFALKMEDSDTEAAGADHVYRVI